MNERKHLDVKDFPLLGANDADYFTFNIVSKTNGNNSRRASCTETEVKEKSDISADNLVTVKIEPDDFSISMDNDAEKAEPILLKQENQESFNMHPDTVVTVKIDPDEFVLNRKILDKNNYELNKEEISHGITNKLEYNIGKRCYQLKLVKTKR